MQQLVNRIKAWFASKGGVAHVIAAAFAFFTFAFATYPAFHSWVMQVWSHVPPTMRDFLVMAAGLWALYKKWDRPTTPPPVSGADSK